MTHHFSMGAINKTTCNYEYPKIATKQNLEKQELELEYIHKKKREELSKQKEIKIVKNYQPSVANYFKK